MSEFEGLKTHVIRGDESLNLMSCEISVLSGPDAGQRVRIRDGLARIGTAPGNHLRLKDPTVSRVHCEIQTHPDRIRIIDRESTNGTFVSGVRVRDAEVTAGATVQIGQTSLSIDPSQGTVPVPLSDRDRYGDIVGASVEMRRVYSILERAAATEATVLVLGETGTGKELVARAIHDSSPRANGPFVAFDCGAVAPNLIESELFGHVRGAFSGAVSDRRGVFEEAKGGTLFFDELGELPLSLQPKLLRAIESRTVKRLGSNQVVPVDVRIVAATNVALAEAINRGTFREDLYFRVAVIEIELPPLRARRDDLATLAKHFYTMYNPKEPEPPQDLLQSVMSRSWPGNVRELRNFIERSVSLGWTQSLDPDAVAAAGAALPQVDVEIPFKQARRAWTQAYVRAALEQSGGNVTRAAEHSGLSRRFFQRLIAKLNRPATDDDALDD